MTHTAKQAKDIPLRTHIHDWATLDKVLEGLGYKPSAVDDWRRLGCFPLDGPAVSRDQLPPAGRPPGFC